MQKKKRKEKANYIHACKGQKKKGFLEAKKYPGKKRFLFPKGVYFVTFVIEEFLSRHYQVTDFILS